MANAESRSILSEAARLEATAQYAGAALACFHDSAEELHKSLVSDYLMRTQGQGFWSRIRALSIFSL